MGRAPPAVTVELPIVYRPCASIKGFTGMFPFGPFSSREQAEECVLALAARQDVLSVSIEARAMK